MKRIISIVLLIMIVVSVILIIVTAHNQKNTDTIEYKTLYGDAYRDNNVNIKDATTIQLYLNKLIPENKINIHNARVNDYLKLSDKDASLIQEYIANIIDVFPIEENDKVIDKTIYYDDYWDISEEFPDSTIQKINEESIYSFKVINGVKTKTRDNKLLDKISDTSCHAVGTGYCYVEIVPNYLIDEYKSKGNEVEGVKIVNLFISPAPLNMVYVCGQSDAYGLTSDNLVDINGVGKIQDSVLCPKGQVYSTLFPYYDIKGKEVSGISDIGEGTFINYLSYLPSSLTSSNSLYNSQLSYPLNSLTANGHGKTGPDSGFAYEYNRLSNEKVWIINTAVGNSQIANWEKGSYYYELSLLVYKKCNEIRDEEIKANHYTKSRQIILWMQGDGDIFTEFDEYYYGFIDMLDSFDIDLGYDIFSMIISRSSVVDGDYNGYWDLSLIYPRVIQNYFANSIDYPKVFLTSRVNELWITENDIKKYFKDIYPSGHLDYPLRLNSTIRFNLPDSLELVHGDIHFGQAGHNENGIDSAKNTYNQLYKNRKTPSLIYIDEDGHFVYDEYYASEKSFVLSSRFDPPNEGKYCYKVFDDSIIDFDEESETFTFLEYEDVNIDVYYYDELIHTLTIHPNFEIEELY